jgi:DNA-binding response OmpR family regulator
MTKRILIVEDDTSLARLLSDNLHYEGFTVDSCDAANEVLARMQRFRPDMVLLDLMLSNGGDGFAVLSTIGQRPDRTPVIVLTARTQKEDRIRGLTLGADDYVTKPFALDELLARVHAVLRRTTPRLHHVHLGDATIDFRALRAYAGSHDIPLTDREFEVLRCLAEHVGNIVTRDELLQMVWGYAEGVTTRTVDNFIFRLRQKLEPDPHHPRYIRTAYGDGYRLSVSGTSEGGPPK